jgi:hypothetical protein
MIEILKEIERRMWMTGKRYIVIQPNRLSWINYITMHRNIIWVPELSARMHIYLELNMHDNYDRYSSPRTYIVVHAGGLVYASFTLASRHTHCCPPQQQCVARDTESTRKWLLSRHYATSHLQSCICRRALYLWQSWRLRASGGLESIKNGTQGDTTSEGDHNKYTRVIVSKEYVKNMLGTTERT